jgi:hypothetical protein
MGFVKGDKVICIYNETFAELRDVEDGYNIVHEKLFLNNEYTVLNTLFFGADEFIELEEIPLNHFHVLRFKKSIAYERKKKIEQLYDS